MSNKTSPFKKKQSQSIDTSESIHLKVEEFLNSGGKIKQIDSGVSGVTPHTGRKHITITPKNS